MTGGESSQNNLILIFKRKQEVAYFKSCWVLKMDLFMDLSHNQRTNFCSLLSYIRKCSFFLTENADMEGSMCMIKHCLVAQSCPTLCDLIDYSQALLSTGTLLARILEWVVIPSSRGSSQPGIEPRSPTLQVDSLLTQPPGNDQTHFSKYSISRLARISRICLREYWFVSQFSLFWKT